MIYWDNAATTYPKPRAVREAMAQALIHLGANPGRGSYPMSLQTARMLFGCREGAGALFDAPPEAVVLTPSCTAALNTVLRGLLQGGGHAVISDLEHNAVVRVLHALSPAHPIYDIAAVVPHDAEQTVRHFERLLRPDTKVICCTAASNVFGLRTPLPELYRLAQRSGIPLVVDAAQGAGLLTAQQLPCDYLCAAGHKGLYGPMGTGLLVCRTAPTFAPLLQGGTGTASRSAEQPSELPEGFESGTLNVPGFAGLAAGIGFVRAQDPAKLLARETALMRTLHRALQGVRGITLYTPEPDGQYLPLLSLNIGQLPCEQAAELLAQRGIAVRAGLHCAPLAHKKYGTLARGTVRLCPCAFTTEAQVQKTFKILAECAGKSLQ